MEVSWSDEKNGKVFNNALDQVCDSSAIVQMI